MKEIRRKDRILEESRALELLDLAEYGFLAMVNVEGGGYGIPISFVKHNNSIYFHCAPEGHKLQNLASDNRVTFTVVGNTKVIPENFTTAYESAMVFGTLHVGLSTEERRHALRLLIKKYSPGYEEVGEKYIDKSFDRTEIIKLSIESITAKAKKIS